MSRLNSGGARSRGAIHNARTITSLRTGTPFTCDRVRIKPYQTRMKSTRPPYMAISPRKLRGCFVVSPTPGTPKNHAPESFNTKGDPSGTEPSGDGGDGDEPEHGRPDEQPRPVAVDGTGLEVGTDQCAEGPAPPHGLVPDRQAVEDTPGDRDRPKGRSRVPMRRSFPLDPSCRPSP